MSAIVWYGAGSNVLMTTDVSLSRRVEFVGLCGAGKSTFYELLKVRLSRAGLSLAERRPVNVSATRTLFYGGQFTAAMALRGGGGARFLMHPENWWLPFKLGYRIAQMNQRAPASDLWPLDVDSGLLQPIISFAAEHNRRLDRVPLAAILPLLALPQVLIYMRAAPALALRRYLARERLRLDAGAEQQFERQFGYAYAVCETVVAECRKAGALVIDVDADQSRSDDATERVAEMLRNNVGRSV